MKRLVLIMLVGLCSCDFTAQTNSFIYTKDHRTNLCYAFYADNGREFTNVPCTPEVERLLTK